MVSDSAPDLSTIPLAYRLFFLYLEPVTALVGALYAGAFPAQYLAYLTPSPSPTPEIPPTGTRVALYQLANLFVFCALSEALVLRSTAGRRTWRALLLALLAADAGHLVTMVPLAGEKGWLRVFGGGDMVFVYVAMGMRVAFLFGVGMGRRGSGEGREAGEEDEAQRLVGGES